MLKFDNFLTESLNNPAEYFMTDDTVLPKRVYGMYSHDGMDYGISLEESNLPKIYEMKVYRLVNGKARYWKFKNANHMRVALATALKFTEATVPFIKTHMNGVFVRLAKDKTNARVQKLANAMVSRLFIKSFRSVPVVIDKSIEMPKSHVHQFIFFARKEVNPKSAFNAKMFKNYVFDMDGTIPAEMAMDIQPKKRSPVVYTTKKSKKYSFGKLELNVDYQAPAELLDSLENDLKAAPMEKSDAEAEKQKTKEKIAALEVQIAGSKKLLDKFKVSNKQFLHMIISGKTNDEKAENLKKLAEVAKYGENEYDMWDLRYYIEKAFDVWREKNEAEFDKLLEVLRSSGIIDFLSPTYEFKNDMANYAISLHKGDAKYENTSEINTSYVEKINKLTNEIGEMNNEIYLAKNSLENTFITKKSNINPAEFPVDVPGNGTIYIDGTGAFKEKGQDLYQKKAFIQDDMGMYKSWAEDLTDDERTYLRYYTGSSYKKYNAVVRKAADAYIDNVESKKSITVEDLLEYEAPLKIMDAFTKIKPIDKGFWVYRTGYAFGELKKHLEIGDDYLETGITSTTIDTDMNFNSSNVRMAIYLPPGSRVIPVLNSDQSSHENEAEVILPPMSIFKIVEKNEQDEAYYNDDSGKYEVKHHLACVYKGAAFEDFLERIRNDAASYGSYQEQIGFVERIIMEERKKQMKEVGNKFGAKLPSKKQIDKVTKLIKSGKLKLDTKKGNK